MKNHQIRTNMKNHLVLTLCVGWAISTLLPAVCESAETDTPAQSMTEASGDTRSLAKAAQNPVANMISVPIQNNFNFGVGPTDGVQYNTLWQPVYPISLTEDWNLINRAIIPVPMYQPRVSSSQGSTWGIGDIQYEAFISPANPGKVIWAVGPYLSFPSASSDVLGTGKWSAGPAVVALTMPGHWVFGALASQLWSFAGDDDRSNVSFGTLQYFINYNIPNGKGWYLTSSPTMTANWNAAGSQQFTVPVGGGVGKIFKIGKQSMNAKIQAFGYPVKPDGGPDWGLQFQLTFLFPQ
jgi:hypothetical protein